MTHKFPQCAEDVFIQIDELLNHRKECPFLRRLLAAVMRNRGILFLIRLIRRYQIHDVAQQGAALAYYLLFSLFPILILVSSLIGQLEPDLTDLPKTLAPILPEGVLIVVNAYLSYVSEHVSLSMLYFSAVFSVWFPMRATACLMRAVRRAYDLGTPKSRIRHTFKVLFYTILLLVSLLLTLLLMTLGRRFMTALGGILSLPGQLTRLWGVLRLLVLGLIVFAALAALYATAQDKRCPLRSILPGAAVSTLAWIVISSGYAFYAENISNYSAIYGALGAIVVLLIWLYLTSLTLIVGAEINHALQKNAPDRLIRPCQGRPGK